MGGKGSGMETKSNEPTKEQQAIIDEVAEWIDTDMIATGIAEELADCGIPITLGNMKDVWYDVLENILCDGMECAIKVLRDTGKIQEWAE